MSLNAVCALNFSIAQLTDILGLCFADYFVPLSLTPEVFATRFGSEGISFEDSCVWLRDNAPVAIAIVVRRAAKARLAAFAIRPEFRGHGLAKQMLSPLLSALAKKHITQVSLEVIAENVAAVALYQSLGFRIRQELRGFKGPRAANLSSAPLEMADPEALLRAVYSAPREETPWLLDPIAFPDLPCQVIRDDHHAWGVVTTFTQTPQIRYLFVEPAFRHQGRARKLLRKINTQWPGIGTSVVVPESFTPLFRAAGYDQVALTQYEMRMLP